MASEVLKFTAFEHVQTVACSPGFDSTPKKVPVVPGMGPNKSGASPRTCLAPCLKSPGRPGTAARIFLGIETCLKTQKIALFGL